MGWLVRHRSADQVAKLISSLALMRRRLAMHPGIGELVAERGSGTIRIVPVGRRLPYLVWYYYDQANESAPLWLIMLRHEKQDRERLDPAIFD